MRTLIKEPFENKFGVTIPGQACIVVTLGYGTEINIYKGIYNGYFINSYGSKNISVTYVRQVGKYIHKITGECLTFNKYYALSDKNKLNYEYGLVDEEYTSTLQLNRIIPN